MYYKIVSRGFTGTQDLAPNKQQWQGNTPFQQEEILSRTRLT